MTKGPLARIPTGGVTGYNIAAPGANTNILATNLTPTSAGWFSGQIVLAVPSVVNYTMTDGTTVFTVGLDESSTIPAGDTYQFSFPVHPNFAYNFRVETDGLIRQLLVFETAEPPGLPANLGTVTVGDVNVISVIPGTGATNLGKAEDAIAADGDTGVAMLSVRRDAAASSAGATGDYATVNTDASGRVYAAANLEIAGAAAPGGAGAVSASTPRATLASDDPAVVALQIIDDWDETNRAAVNPISGQAGVTGGSGVVGAAVQRVVLATDVGLPAGSSNIGDVDVLTVPSPLSSAGGGTEAAALRVTLANDSTGLVSVDDNAGSLTVDNAALAVVGGGVEATALRVTLANDSTGVVSVDDNAGSLTIDNAALAVVGGGVEATALRVTLANDSTGVVSVDDNAGSLTIDNATLAVVGGGVEATAIRVTLANDSTGLVSVDDNAGSLTVDVGTALPAGDANIGNVDIVSQIPGTGATNLGKAVDAAVGATDTGVAALGLRDDALTALTPADGDYTHFRVDRTGALWTHPDVRHRMGKSTTFNVQTSLYAAGDLLNSGNIVFSNVARTSGQGGRILSLKVKDLARQNAAFDLLLFDRTFTVTSANATFDPADADLDNCFAVISVAATDYQAYVDNSTAFIKNLDIAMPPPNAGVAIYGAAITRGAPTYAASGDLDLDLGISQD